MEQESAKLFSSSIIFMTMLMLVVSFFWLTFLYKHIVCVGHFGILILLTFQNYTGSASEFFLVTDPEFSGSPPKRAPPLVPEFVPPPAYTPAPLVATAHILPAADFASSPAMSSVSKSESFNSTQVHELTVDDIEDFEDDDDVDEIESLVISRRTRNDATDLALGLPSFATGILIFWVYIFYLFIYF